MNKSLVLFQAGPVQSFIAAARSTRDLWSGSYMLSWLMAAAAKALTETAGTPVDETIIFPKLSKLGVYQLRTNCQAGKALPEKEEEKRLQFLLNPAMPNRFLAIVPADKAEASAKAAEKAFRDELTAIGDAVWKFLQEQGARSDWKNRWDEQIKLLPEITWQTLQVGDLATDEIYAEAYKDCQSLLAARRNTRNFDQFKTDVDQERFRESEETTQSPFKDTITGKEEIIGTDAFQKALFEKSKRGDKNERLGAISLIKRFWHEEYLRKEYFSLPAKKFYGPISYDTVPEIAEKNTDRNNPYVALITMDGDKMGEWMNGDRRLPTYENDLKDHHKNFSERLANFSNEDAGRLVRNHGGQLIYAGGDDVLAMLPATRVFKCVCELQKAFKEQVDRKQADVSCGIAIAHKKYPLQRMVKEAQLAEKRAKNDYGRGAFAFSLLKHGGEIVRWGAKWGNKVPECVTPENKISPEKAKWDCKARECFEKFCEWQEKEIVSGRFPYALAGYLAPYALEKKQLSINPSEIKEILKAELATVVERQVPAKGVRNEIQEICEEYIEEVAKECRWGDFIKLFLTAAFIYRKRD